MKTTGTGLFEILNNLDYSGLIVYSLPMVIVTVVVFLIFATISLYANTKGAKIANKVINPKTKRPDKNLKLTPADIVLVKKFDIMKYISLGLGVVVFLVGLFLTTTILSPADKDSDKFKDHFKEITTIVAKEKGKVEKTGDKIIYTRTLSGKVDGENFKLKTGQTVDLKKVKGYDKATTKIEVTTEMSSNSRAEVSENMLQVEGKTDFKAVK